MTCTSSEAHTGCKTRVQPCTLRPLQQPKLCSCPLCFRLGLLSCLCLHTRDLLQQRMQRIAARSRISCLQSLRSHLKVPDRTQATASGLTCGPHCLADPAWTPCPAVCHSISSVLGNIQASPAVDIILVLANRQVQVCLPAHACWRPPSLLAYRLPGQASCHHAAAKCAHPSAQGLLVGLRHVATQHGGLLGG